MKRWLNVAPIICWQFVFLGYVLVACEWRQNESQCYPRWLPWQVPEPLHLPKLFETANDSSKSATLQLVCWHIKSYLKNEIIMIPPSISCSIVTKTSLWEDEPTIPDATMRPIRNYTSTRVEDRRHEERSYLNTIHACLTEPKVTPKKSIHGRAATEELLK